MRVKKKLKELEAAATKDIEGNLRRHDPAYRRIWKEEFGKHLEALKLFLATIKENSNIPSS